jgi:hypothetical protein
VYTLALALLPFASAAEPTVLPLDKPPQSIAVLLDDLKGADAVRRKAAADTLARHAEAEPYLRHYRATPRGKLDDLAGAALDALDAARARRIVKRAAEWAKAGRYDLLVDLSLHLPETDQADAVGKLFFDFAERIRPVPEKLGGPEAKHFLDHSMERFSKNAMLRQFHDPRGTVETDIITHGFVRAQSCAASARIRNNWLVLTRQELKGTAQISNQWENCYIFHNGDVTFDSCVWSLVVCDGHIEFTGSADGRSSTILTRGSIRSNGGLKFDTASFYARGDIVTEKESNTRAGLLLAAGKIDVARAPNVVDNKQRVHIAGAKDNPFGVRFFETVDVGVEVALRGKSVTIGRLTAGSPLTKYGIKEGDIVTRVNDKDIKTENDLRRELRYSVVLEAGVFHITRGGQKITRIVYFKDGLEK